MCHRRLSIPAVMLVAALAAGCSADRQIIRSTATSPVSGSIIDTATHQALWSMDVPADHILVLQGHNEDDITFFRVGNHPATRMTWKLYAAADAEHAFTDSNTYVFVSPLETGTIALSGNPVLIEVGPTVAQPVAAPPPAAEPAPAE